MLGIIKNIGIRRWHSAAKNFLLVASGSLILRLISFFTAPLFLSLLSVQEYGLLSLIMSFCNIFSILLSLGLRSTFALEYFHHDEQGKKTLLNDIMSIYCMIAIPCLLYLLYYPTPINRYIFSGQANDLLIRLSLIFSFFYFFTELFYQLLQYKAHIYSMTVIQVSMSLLTLMFAFFSLVYLNMHIIGIMLGYCLGLMIVFALAFFLYIKNQYGTYFMIRTTIKKSMRYIKTGILSAPSVLMVWLLASTSRWLLSFNCSLHEVGIFTLADMFGVLFQLCFIYPLQTTYIPYVLQQLAQPGASIEHIERWNKRNMLVAVLASMAVVLGGVYIARPFLYMLVPIKYHESLQYIVFILGAQIMYLGAQFGIILLQFLKKTSFLLYAVLIAVGCNIVCSQLLIPVYHIYGGVIALLITYTIYFGTVVGYNYYVLANTNRSFFLKNSS